MDSTEKIILSEGLNKSSKNENMSLNTVLYGNKKLLPEDSISDTINLYEEYVRERKDSNKFRLIININPICSNVLFNPFTEIVKYDDSGLILLNYFLETGYTEVSDAVGKDTNFNWTAYDAIRDTQLSNKKCGFDYLCGIDIFNNHILRNKAIKIVNYTDLSNNEISCYEDVYGEAFKNVYVQEEKRDKYKYLISTDFNTIDDYMRDINGVIVSDRKLIPQYGHNRLSVEKSIPLHLYQNYDVYSFEDCVKEKLIEKNGWFGFFNAFLNKPKHIDEEQQSQGVKFDVLPKDISNHDPYTQPTITMLRITLEGGEEPEQDGEEMSINKVINSKGYGDFIDMYPTRELYSFSPLYNERKNRYEKNWNYCLTYPSRSITKQFDDKSDFPFFKELEDKTIALKAISFDEYTVDDDGRNVVTIYSICQHGLKEGDSVNIYRGDELVYNNGKVVKIVDKFTFQVYKESYDISRRYINVDEIEWDDNKEAMIEVLDVDNNIISATCTFYPSNELVMVDNNVYKVSSSRRCNIDPNAQEISFKRVLNNVECNYYVRVFSRLPNFKFTDAEINDYNLYDDKDLDLINRFSNPKDEKCDFENHISNMSFAQTSYGDNDTEIVYTDDIDTSFLKDNLGRPLSEIYLTIVKNNKGYKEWYSSNGIITDDTDIEKSHCFGYNSSSFLFNELYRNSIYENIHIDNLKDVRDLCVVSRNGLKYAHDGSNGEQVFNDEIVFDELRDFYGDICYYCPVECNEYSLGSSMLRFNTVQREFSKYHNVDESFLGKSILFNSLWHHHNDDSGVMFHDEIIDDESGVISVNNENINNLWQSFNSTYNLSHSSFHLNEEMHDEYSYKRMLEFYEGYYYKMHYKIPLKTISESISKDSGITYDIFSIEKSGNNLNIKTVNENNLSLNDKLTLYNKTENKFYYLTVTSAITKFYFTCSVKNEDLSTGFNDSIDSLNQFVLVKMNKGVPEYAKLIKDGSCVYYWRNILSNGIENNDSKIYPFTNGAFYVNRQINFFLRRQDSEKINLGAKYLIKDTFDYVPDGDLLPIEYYENQYYDSEEITC